MMKANIRLLLADDHPVVLEGLRAILSNEPGMEVVGEAKSGEEAISKVAELEPDVVLMDVSMPGVGGMEATKAIKKTHPTTFVIMLTVHDGEGHLVESICSGASGFLTKDTSLSLLCHAVRAVVEGGSLLRSRLLRGAIQDLHIRPKGEGEGVNKVLIGRLSSRELDVLRLLARGYGNKAICNELNLAEVTVKKYVQSIVGKLDVSSRAQATILAVQLGLGGKLQPMSGRHEKL
ncbi:MAG: response regulator transcription factor [Chloroflexi bacterium]|nr:response regulator transcription factor [Chloroflexota bacterium]